MRLLEEGNLQCFLDATCLFPLERVGEAHTQALERPDRKMVLRLGPKDQLTG
jgi:hypothetical protein